MLTRFLAGVADGGAGLDRTLARNRAGPGEDRFKQCGLAALERAHQCDAPWTPATRAVCVGCLCARTSCRTCAVRGHARLPAAGGASGRDWTVAGPSRTSSQEFGAVVKSINDGHSGARKTAAPE